jgi:type I restriction enzyme R subunit
MSLNEFTFEATALKCFRELGYTIGHGPRLAPGEPAVERDSFGEVISVWCLRAVIRWLSPAISSRILANLRETLLPKLLSGELRLPSR